MICYLNTRDWYRGQSFKGHNLKSQRVEGDDSVEREPPEALVQSPDCKPSRCCSLLLCPLRPLPFLQVQMRDKAGFAESRRQLLTLKPNNRGNWIAFAIAQHLQGK